MAGSLASRLQQRIMPYIFPASQTASNGSAQPADPQPSGETTSPPTLWSNPTHHRVRSFELLDIGDELSSDSCASEEEFFDARSCAARSDSSFASFRTARAGYSAAGYSVPETQNAAVGGAAPSTDAQGGCSTGSETVAVAQQLTAASAARAAPELDAAELPAVKKIKPAFSAGSNARLVIHSAPDSPPASAHRTGCSSAARRPSSLKPLTPLGKAQAPNMLVVSLSPRADGGVNLTIAEPPSVCPSPFVFGDSSTVSLTTAATSGLQDATPMPPPSTAAVGSEKAAAATAGAEQVASQGDAPQVQPRASRDTVEDVVGAPALPPVLTTAKEERFAANGCDKSSTLVAGTSPDHKSGGDQGAKQARQVAAFAKPTAGKAGRGLEGLERLLIAPLAIPDSLREQRIQVYSMVADMQAVPRQRSPGGVEGKGRYTQGEEGEQEQEAQDDLSAAMSMMADGASVGGQGRDCNVHAGIDGKTFTFGVKSAAGEDAWGDEDGQEEKGAAPRADATVKACATLQGVVQLMVPAWRQSGGGARPPALLAADTLGLAAAGGSFNSGLFQGSFSQALLDAGLTQGSFSSTQPSFTSAPSSMLSLGSSLLAGTGSVLLLQIPEADPAQELGDDEEQEERSEGKAQAEAQAEGGSLDPFPSLEECQSPVLGGPGSTAVEAMLETLAAEAQQQAAATDEGGQAAGGCALLPPPSPARAGLPSSAASRSSLAVTSQSMAFMQGSVCRVLLTNAVDRLFVSFSVADDADSVAGSLAAPSFLGEGLEGGKTDAAPATAATVPSSEVSGAETAALAGDAGRVSQAATGSVQAPQVVGNSQMGGSASKEETAAKGTHSAAAGVQGAGELTVDAIALRIMARSAGDPEESGAPGDNSPAARPAEGSSEAVNGAAAQGALQAVAGGAAAVVAQDGTPLARKRKADILVLSGCDGNPLGADARAMKKALGVEATAFRMGSAVIVGKAQGDDKASRGMADGVSAAIQELVAAKALETGVDSKEGVAGASDGSVGTREDGVCATTDAMAASGHPQAGAPASGDPGSTRLKNKGGLLQRWFRPCFCPSTKTCEV